MAKGDRRDEGCCSVDFLQIFLHTFNVIFLLAGLVVLGTAVWTLLYKYQYVSLLTTATYSVLTYFLLAAGGLVVVVALVGCCAIQKKHKPLLLFYLFLLVLIFLMEAMVGVLGFIYRELVHSELEMNLNSTFLNAYSYDDEKTLAIDSLQEELQCCGAVTFSDWEYSRWKTENGEEVNKVPDSCCKTIKVACGKRDHPSNINYSGCLNKMENHFKNHLSILSAVGLGICVIQIFGIIYACQLYIKIKN